MQMMLDTVEDFAGRYNITFSTDPDPKNSKSKCIFVFSTDPDPLLLAKEDVWASPPPSHCVVTSFPAYGSGLMDHDAIIKRGQFIDKSVEVRNMFQWAAPAEVLEALKIYCSDFYGSMLWDLRGDKASEVYSACDTAVKLTWSCPRWTRTFLLQQALACSMRSARTYILGRYGKFCLGLRTSVCQKVRVLFNFVSRDM